jgi:hypothetical protein
MRLISVAVLGSGINQCCLPALDGLANIGVVNFRCDFAFHREFATMVLPKLCGMLAAIFAAAMPHSYVAMLVGIGMNRTLLAHFGIDFAAARAIGSVSLFADRSIFLRMCRSISSL